MKDVQLSAKEGNVCPLSRTFYCTSGGWSWLAGTQAILVLWPSVCSLLSPWSHIPEGDSFCLSVPLFAFLSVCVSLSLLSTCLLLPLSPFLFYVVSGLLIFSSCEHSWGNFSVLMALATTSNHKTGGSKAIVSSAKFHASHFPVSTGISPFVHHYKRYLTNSKYMPWKWFLKSPHHPSHLFTSIL